MKRRIFSTITALAVCLGLLSPALAADIPEDAVAWAAQNGIAGGYGDGRLGPKGQATRAQVAQMLKNCFEFKAE